MTGSFADLLARARAGDEAARTDLWASHRGRVLRRIETLMSARLRKRHDPEDILQVVSLAFLAKLGEFEDDGERAFLHWLYTVAEGKVRDAARRLSDAKGRRREATLATAAGAAVPSRRGRSPATEAAVSADEAAVRAALAELTPDERAVVDEGNLDAPDWKALAVRLGAKSPDALRKSYPRLLARLAKRLAGLRRGWATR